MNTLTPDALVRQLRWRYAVKKFDPTKAIPADAWAALEQALVLAPSSYGLQPWKFFVVADRAVKEKLVPASWNQPQPRDCSHYVVLGVRHPFGEADIDRHVARTAEVTGVPAESLAGFRKMMLGSATRMSPVEVEAWTRCQAYIALGQFMAAAAAIGVDTCPMEGFEPAKYDEILGLTAKGYTAAVSCAAGYRAADDKQAARPKVRFPVSEMVEYV